VSEKYEFVDTTLSEPKCPFPVILMCRWLEVSTSGFYSWRARPDSATARRRDVLKKLISAELYQTLYLQARGELRTQLSLALRRGRTRRVNRSRAVARGNVVGMVNISERPVEAEDRAVPGFWEGDLIIGQGGRSQIATLVERSTRYVMLVRVPYDRTADRVAIVLAQKMATLPEFLRNSITWDQGKELAAHAKFTVATGIPVYFCDPHSPWQRGSNEYTNGLLRQYFPKAPTCPCTPKHTSTPSPPNSTADPGRPSTGRTPPRNSTNSWSKPVAH
jgi:IS30 family transposase